VVGTSDSSRLVQLRSARGIAFGLHFLSVVYLPPDDKRTSASVLFRLALCLAGQMIGVRSSGSAVAGDARQIIEVIRPALSATPALRRRQASPASSA
jgi:hypothetical protein